MFLISYLGRQTDFRSNRTANAIKHNKQASSNFKNTARVIRLYISVINTVLEPDLKNVPNRNKYN